MTEDDKARWRKAYDAITDLKGKVWTLLNPEGVKYEYELRERHEQADAAIADWVKTYAREAAALDPELLEQFFGVFAVRQFAYEGCVARLQRQALGQVRTEDLPDISLRQLRSHMGSLRAQLDNGFAQLKPYWDEYARLGKAPNIDFGKHKDTLAAFRGQKERLKAAIDRLGFLDHLWDAVDSLRNDWLTLSNETDWLERVAKKCAD